LFLFSVQYEIFAPQQIFRNHIQRLKNLFIKTFKKTSGIKNIADETENRNLRNTVSSTNLSSIN